MTNEERNTIIAVWGDSNLRIKLEDNPYGLTRDDLRSLKVNDSLENLVRLSGRGPTMWQRACPRSTPISPPFQVK